MTQWKDPMVHEDDIGTVVIILPLEPPKFEFDWIVGFVQYVYKWLEYGKRIIVLPGPRGEDTESWEKVRRDAYHTMTDVLNEKPNCRHLIQHFLPVAATFSGTESCLAGTWSLQSGKRDDIHGCPVQNGYGGVAEGAWKRRPATRAERP
ncbi:hypothetical protein Y032_0057g2818 [Ancylostoma ceylanicum]|uniref:Uncharacterized protein n=1 Tax=Ancylostoma ceylanicum TaxID=53326 RepID=A0A016U6I2_9BILA|nr:hypothetical protein Y032_0057g2818 [Ancylostoma ceylanicum]